MSGLIKVLLLLAAAACVSSAIVEKSGANCLCQQTRNRTDGSVLKDIQIYPATIFCDRVEIVVTTGSGLRYCLNHEAKSVRQNVMRILRSKRAARNTPPSV